MPTYPSQMTFGERLADRVATFGGSWTFIGLFLGAMVIWIVINSRGAAVDPFPFILLNLMLSCLAALQAPVIMMSQNRQSAKDRLDAQHDYEVNLKAEMEIVALHFKMDELREKQFDTADGSAESPDRALDEAVRPVRPRRSSRHLVKRTGSPSRSAPPGAGRIGLMRRISGWLAWASAVAILVAPHSARAQSSDVLIFAAASLRNVIDDLAAPCKQATGVGYKASYAASSTLAKQIAEGAPADIFISADLEWMDDVAKRASDRERLARQSAGQ